jgi:hypothetical protein
MAGMTESEKLRANATGTELVWEGKRTQVERVPQPFQVIETINQSRATREQTPLLAGLPTPPLFESATVAKDVWRNKLIWGDNKYVLASLLEEGFAGKINLIYIDPPFDTGDDFSFRVKVGDEELVKQPSIIEQKAYNDTWGKGTDSYLQMMYERLLLMRELMAENGNIWIHIGTNVSNYIQCIADEVFDITNRRNQVAVKRITKNLQRQFESVQALPEGHDVLLWYSRQPQTRFRPLMVAQEPKHLEGYWKDFWSTADRPTMRYGILGVEPTSGQWKWSQERAEEAVQNYKEYQETIQPKGMRLLEYWTETGRKLEFIRRSPTGKIEHWIPPLETKFADTLWLDVSAYSFTTGFNTEKSEQLLQRVISNFSNPGDLVADFFCGSGTTLAVAEKRGRRWIGCDLGRFAIHTTRKRLLDIPDCKPFEILNLGKYERKYWQMNGISGRQKDSQKAIFEYLAFIVKLYHAEPVIGFSHLHGRKAGRMVHVGATDAPVTLSEIIEALEECSANKLTALDVLGWEWEMGLHDVVGNEAKRRGIDLRLLNIPREVMDKRAVEAGDVHFYELAYVETEVRQQGIAVQVALKDFIIPSLELVPLEVRDKVKKWSDYIDYWAIDWDFKEDTFHNQWQSYRTRKHPTLAAESEWHTYPSSGAYKLLVKIVDIFGNDTTKLLEVKV